MGLDCVSCFDNIKSFLRDLNRKFGLCNLRYAEYTVERLEICLGSVSLVIIFIITITVQNPYIE